MADTYAASLHDEIERSVKRRAEMVAELDRLRAREVVLREVLEMYERSTVQPRQVGDEQLPEPTDKPRITYVMEQLDGAGPEGLTVAEMMKSARDAGYQIKEATLRSQLWHRKEKGKIENIDGRWRKVRPKNTGAADEDESSAAPNGGLASHQAHGLIASHSAEGG